MNPLNNLKGRKIIFIFLCLIKFQLAQSQEASNIFYIGAGYQYNNVKNAFYGNQKFYNDNAKGLIPKIAYEDFDEDTWYKLDFSLLLNAALSPILKKPGLVFENYQDYNPASKASNVNAFMFNDKFIHATGSFTPGKQDLIGPLLSFGWEGIGIVGANEKGKQKSLTGFRAFNANTVGVISFGTGINILNPLRKYEFAKNSRLTLSYDWLLGREYDEKFRSKGKKRIGLELAVFLHRFISFNIHYQFISFKRSMYYNETVDIQYGHTKVHSVGAGLNLYIFNK